MNNFKKIVYFLIILYILHIFYIVLTQRFFYADGVHYFIKLLQEKSFIYSDDFARHHAHYITQFPLVILLKYFNYRNVDILSYIYGFSLYLPQMLNIIISLYLLKKINTKFIIFPLISIFGISMNMSFMIVHELHVIVNLFWPLLFYIVYIENYKWWDYLIVITISIITVRCYEIAIFLNSILLTLSLVTIYRKRNILDLSKKTLLIFLIIIFSISIIIAFISIINSRCPENKAFFLSTIVDNIHNYLLITSFLFTLFISITFLFPGIINSMIYSLSFYLLVLFGFFISISPIILSDLIKPYLHYTARSYIAIMLPLFSVFTIYIINNSIKFSELVWSKTSKIVTLLIIFQLLWQCFATLQWQGFKSVFKNMLTQHSGFVEFEDTILVNKNIGIQLIRPFTWDWNNPSLSLIWSNDGYIKTIVLNPKYYTRWQPFDPNDISNIPNLSEYGIFLGSEILKDKIK